MKALDRILRKREVQLAILSVEKLVKYTGRLFIISIYSITNNASFESIFAH